MQLYSCRGLQCAATVVRTVSRMATSAPFQATPPPSSSYARALVSVYVLRVPSYAVVMQVLCVAVPAMCGTVRVGALDGCAPVRRLCLPMHVLCQGLWVNTGPLAPSSAGSPSAFISALWRPKSVAGAVAFVSAQKHIFFSNKKFFQTKRTKSFQLNFFVGERVIGIIARIPQFLFSGRFRAATQRTCTCPCPCTAGQGEDGGLQAELLHHPRLVHGLPLLRLRRHVPADESGQQDHRLQAQRPTALHHPVPQRALPGPWG